MIQYSVMKTAFAYATDEKFVKLTAISLHSLQKANPGTDIIILADCISEESSALLKRIVDKHGGTLRIIDVQKELYKIKNIGASEYVSFSVYSRLFIPEVVGDKFDRIIYLDGDTLVVSGLQTLYSLDLGRKPFAVGYDCICNKYKKLIGISPDAPYFNTGVLVMDIAEWNHRRCTERIFEYMRNVRHNSILGDQDYFALVLSKDAAILPPEYNFLTHFQLFKTRNVALCATGTPECAWYSEAQYTSAQKRPAIHHFLGHTLGRPWYQESLNPLRETYQRFAAEAGVGEITKQSRPVEFHYWLQYLFWRILPQPLFALAVRIMYEYFFRTRYGV